MIRTFFKQSTPFELVIFFLYLIVVLCLFVYSFTQIDLSLALSRVQSVQDIVVQFQHIGYFQRPLSTTLYISIVLLITAFYLLFLRKAFIGTLKKVYLWGLVGITAILLTFSYNAFSYDIFNYIFDAKIVTHYGDNPYNQKALDYPTDPMLSFMRWTHREYPYGPVWLGITVPISFLGFNIFIITFFMFKLLATAAYVGTVYYIGKVAEHLTKGREVLAMVFFGLNPLIIIESVVSAHIDIVMIFLAIWALWLLVQRQTSLAYLLLFMSIGIKFVTGFFLPVFLFLHRKLKKKHSYNWDRYAFVTVFFLIVAVVFETQQSGNFQPWYLIVPLAFAAFIAHNYFILLPSIIISTFALFTYVPFLYTGNWDPPIPQHLSDMYFFSYSISLFAVAVVFFYKQIRYAQSVKNKKEKKR